MMKKETKDKIAWGISVVYHHMLVGSLWVIFLSLLTILIYLLWMIHWAIPVVMGVGILLGIIGQWSHTRCLKNRQVYKASPEPSKSHL